MNVIYTSDNEPVTLIPLETLEAGMIKQDGELLVHPDAIMIEPGMAYTMPQPDRCMQHRDDGRGRCIDCGAFL